MDGVISNNGYSFKLFFTHYHEVDHVAWFHALEIVSCRCCVYGCVKLPWTLSKINTSSCHERLKKKTAVVPVRETGLVLLLPAHTTHMHTSSIASLWANEHKVHKPLVTTR
jgi:hypothetical protein